MEYPSQWRDLELKVTPGDRIEVVFDRAGRRAQTEIVAVARARAPDRGSIARLREEQRMGVVVRTATEVEARAAGLAPGGGAVIVGLSKRSPLRQAGLQFGDLIVAVGERVVADPVVVLDEIRGAGDTLDFTYEREGTRRTASVPTTARRTELRELGIPLLFSYERDRDRSSTSVLLGLFGHESTEAAWQTRLLWFITFGGGTADELLEVDG